MPQQFRPYPSHFMRTNDGEYDGPFQYQQLTDTQLGYLTVYFMHKGYKRWMMVVEQDGKQRTVYVWAMTAEEVEYKYHPVQLSESHYGGITAEDCVIYARDDRPPFEYELESYNDGQHP